MAKNDICTRAFSLFFFFLLFSMTNYLLAKAQTTVNVGMVFAFNNWFGKMGLSSINMSLSDFYASHPNYLTRLVLHSRNSPSDDNVVAASAALELIKNVQVQAIIGPSSSTQTNFLISLGHKAQVPIITYSATSPSLTSISKSSYFVRAAQNDTSQVRAISAIIQAFGWREVVTIYVDDEFGEGVIPYLSDALQEIDARIAYRSVISPQATDDQIAAEIHKLKGLQTQVFIVHMNPDLGFRVFEKAKKIGLMEKGYAWIMTNGMTNSFRYINSSVIGNMQGVLGIKPYVPFPYTKELHSFEVRWKRKFLNDNPTLPNVKLGVFGLWAHDAAWALAMAVEKVGAKNFSSPNVNGFSNSTTDLQKFGVSQNGPQLVQALLATSFKGLSGDFNLHNGELQSSTFQIGNVIGNGETLVGYWTPKKGLQRNLNLTDSSRYSTSNVSLGSIIWPGHTTSAPKGWQIPKIGKKLRILVPVKQGFSEFVNVKHDPRSNTTTVDGYCINVFDAVIKSLPYDVPYELYPYAEANGEITGSYDELVDQVFLENYDGAVGDITIRANRSLYVDFTLPFTDSGVFMVVPVKDNINKNAWEFSKPLTPRLWAATACSFIFIALLVWFLEHRINKVFQGSLGDQIGTMFWFAFSTMVFAHRQPVVSNLTRFVLIIWCFVVLILSQSYTANLASVLTVQQLQPTVTDVNLLLRNRDNVGYQKGSFVPGILKQLGFQDENLKIYESPQELHQLFQNGTKEHGISAAFDETPYMRLFLATYCSKYTMIDPTFKADGFAFAFPKGSPLAHDVSRAILNVGEGDKMKDIEKFWFKRESMICAVDPNNLVSMKTNSLRLESFWGLLAITGGVSALALLVVAVKFLWKLDAEIFGALLWATIVFISTSDICERMSRPSMDSEPNEVAMVVREEGQGGDDMNPGHNQPANEDAHNQPAVPVV